MKHIFKKLLFPPGWLLAILSFLSAAVLIFIFAKGLEESTTGLFAVFIYGSYMLAAYSLTALCVFCAIVFPHRYRQIKQRVYSNKFGKDRRKELRRSRLCGMILVTVNLALSGVVFLVISRNEGFQYSGMLIYIMAMYSFYITVNSIVSLFRYRKYNSPLIMTAKGINFAASLVSMLTLEIAMLSQFGGESAAPHFNQVMIDSTGAAVCVIVLTISVYIIGRTNQELKNARY